MVRLSLSNIKDALNGLIVFSFDLEKALANIMVGKVPSLWMTISYPSLKPLGGYIKDLVARIAFFSKWVEEGKPVVYWLSGFFFPQGFLTSVLQSHSRKKEVAISKLTFSFNFKNADSSTINSGPEYGCYIHGLFMEGARLEPSRMILVDNPEGVMNNQAPVIHFNPEEDHERNPNDYPMPLYKTIKRAGSMSATGAFVLTIYTPTRVDPEYWILNGAAYVCALN